jgi:hypothetical protein
MLGVSIRSYQKYHERPYLYYIAYLGFFLIGVIIFSLTEYITKQGVIQLKVATFAYGWSLLPFPIASAFFVFYLYRLNGDYGIISYLYIICFTAVCVEFFHFPWVIEWKDGVGYIHIIENTFLIYFFAQMICLLIIIIQTIHNVEKHVRIEKETAYKNKAVPKEVIQKIKTKQRNLHIIRYSYLFGITMGLISMIPEIEDIDYYAFMIINIPQVLILYRNRHIMNLTKSTVRSVYFIKKSGLIILDWHPGEPYKINPTLVGGLNTGIKTLAEKVFRSESSTHKLEFQHLVIFGQEKEYQASQEPEKLAILIVSDYLTPFLEYVVSATLNRFILSFQDKLSQSLQEVTQYQDFIPELEKLFKIFL